MAEKGNMGNDEIQNLMEKNPHLKAYVEGVKKKMGEPAISQTVV